MCSSASSARYHFSFTGSEDQRLTVVIADQQITVEQGHQGQPDLEVSADSQTWINVLAGERSMVSALLTRRVRLKGPLRLLIAFGKCFPAS